VTRKACTGCHALPTPDILPRAAWGAKVYEMIGLITGGIGAPKDGPPPSYDFEVERVVHFYEARAPLSLPSPEPWPDPAENPLRLARHPFRPAGLPATPGVANVRFLDLDRKGRPQIVASDMNHGLVLSGSPSRPGAGLRVIGRVPNPCHAEAVDLDRDRRLDLLVADLGDIPPGDHLKGSVVWLRQLAGGSYRKHVLASGLPRVADVEAADFDGDGDLDLVVAAFGWRQVGSVLLLENRTGDWSAPVFVPRVVDPRPGAIHVPPADLDGDGRPDFVGLLAQHYETVVAYVNAGGGAFRPHPIYAAPHPAWGSSGIQLVDLDGDGDLDVVLTHGDMLDDFLIKPWHGIQWLENRGGLNFVEHDLAALPGVEAARAADLDEDGDMDIVAVTLVQTSEADARGPRLTLPSLVWLEQVAPGRFQRHTLEVGGHHVTLDLGDYDGDGDVDIVVGNFRARNDAWVEVWENLGVRK
jgi:hypothetical protein